MLRMEVVTRSRQEFVEITSEARRIVRESGVVEGTLLVFCPHTTAGITVNENADPDVVGDMIRTLDRLIPVAGDYAHVEGNSHAHLKASLMGTQKCFIISDGRLTLGTWQGIYFCEFDGPRRRQVWFTVIKDQ